ncbi:TolC family protein [Trinickia soli]|uniref:Protein CyaE n=3 Tax=Trinickia soli TaxID=380675 RepID=A0A2N7WCJ3_9BURK|nr:TolC family protein [Trinickia soli]
MRICSRWPAVCSVWAGLLCIIEPAHAFDPLFAEHAIPATPAASMGGDAVLGSCAFNAMGTPLRLQEAVERALCKNPKTREAWADVKAAAAAVGKGRSAYLPQVTGNWQGTRDETKEGISGFPQFDSTYRNSVLRNESISLSWVLYDFGGRKAALANANALLAAARATENATLQAVFATVARDYYAAQAAQGAFITAKEVEATSAASLKAATMRVDHGAAPISDQLQAQTSWANAVVERTKAERDWQTALGTLAADMSVEPYASLALPDVADGVAPDAQFDESVADLINDAKRFHPSVAAAEAELEAAQAKVRQTRAEGLPKVSFVAKYSWNNQPTSLQLGVPQTPAATREWYLGIQVTIPFFEGFGRAYDIHQAQAEAEKQGDMLEEARQQVGLDVWTSYQALQAAGKNVANSATLLDVAQKSYAAAQRRYEIGVGGILELLNAQSSLAGAKRQRIGALTDWRSERLQLAAKLGKLGMWNLLPDH